MTLDEVKDFGCRANMSGHPKDANPYLVNANPEKHAAWNDGWDQAQKSQNSPTSLNSLHLS